MYTNTAAATALIIMTHVSPCVSLREAGGHPLVVHAEDLKLGLLHSSQVAVLELGKEAFPHAVHLLPLPQHLLVVGGLQEARVDVVLHQLVDLLLWGGYVSVRDIPVCVCVCMCVSVYVCGGGHSSVCVC